MDLLISTGHCLEVTEPSMLLSGDRPAFAYFRSGDSRADRNTLHRPHAAHMALMLHDFEAGVRLRTGLHQTYLVTHNSREARLRELTTVQLASVKGFAIRLRW